MRGYHPRPGPPRGPPAQEEATIRAAVDVTPGTDNNGIEARRERRRRLLGARIAVIRIVHRLATVLPQRRDVVLATSHAPAIGGNLAFIRDELARREPPIEVRVLAYATRRGRRGLVQGFVNAMRAAVHMATTRLLIVDDYFFPLYVIKRRRGLRVIQTWHASGAFKRIGYSVLDKTFGADEELIGRVPIHSNYDVCLMASQAAAVHYAEAFRQPLERFVTNLGIPRTDALFGAERIERLGAELRTRYDLPTGKRVILYAPTFRGETVLRARSPQDLDLARMQELLGEDHVLLLKLHPFVRDRQQFAPSVGRFVRDATDYPDINDLMHVSDVLLTDYSSAIYEFSLLVKPMVFFTPDHAAYERERGFYF
ncbi:MAG TPA: CDP-glycerol glycerophosphotransferase family protein, partial [Candidatus Deferrimicrobiaceae bacterium]|nr:CDP-glycerol glycerophosphotransferase family protein [Candidatus Deferrimicrobiaceae bacterium]